MQDEFGSGLSLSRASQPVPYPPGIPLFVPGERINEQLVDYLKTGSAEGFYAEGCADQSLKTVRVVA